MTHDQPADGRAGMRRVRADAPCPVCGKPDWCLAAPDGSAAICARTEGANRCGDAGWLHRLEPTADHKRPRQKTTKTTAPTDWAALAATFAANLDAGRRERLAAKLKLPVEALAALPLLGFQPDDPAGGCFTFPEMNASGQVIGLNRRFENGTKKAMSGARRGLTLPAGWRDRPGPVCVVEGPTDAVALTAAGVCAIGRPSNRGGVAHLAEVLRDLDRDVLVLGENDEKVTGWPGLDGAVSVSRGLASALRRVVSWTLPPGDAKDVREWLTADARSVLPWTERGAELLAELTASARQTDPPNDPPDGPGAPAPDSGPNDGPENPHRLANGYLDSPRDGAGEHWRGALRFWRGQFHEYEAGAYRAIPDDDQRAKLSNWIRSEFVRLNAAAVAAWAQDESEKKGECPRVRPVTQRLLGDVGSALCGLCLLVAHVDAPVWLDGAAGPDPSGLLAVRNGILDLGALADGRPQCLLPPTPLFFTPTAAPFDFDRSAPRPARWLAFLSDVWPEDPESVATLQEWFGYLLTPDTRQQKILFLLGPKRGGKGTIVRVLRELVGPANVAGPTLGSLASNFGLSPLLGRPVAVTADARLSGRADAAVITERLLSISGEDALTIDRKHREPLTVKLPTRFVILSNELPRLGDASGALAGRLIVLRLTRSWFRRENTGLFDELRAELPGILLWAVEGWRRLRDRGRFVQPASGAELVEEMEDLSSPISAFVRDRCFVASGERVEVAELYRAWRDWCDAHGRKEPGTEETFGRDLRAAVSSVRKARPRTEAGRVNVYFGIRVRRDSDPDPDPPGGHPGHGGHSDQGMHAAPEEVTSEPAEGATGANGNTISGHGDHGDRGACGARFENDDRLYERMV